MTINNLKQGSLIRGVMLRLVNEPGVVAIARNAGLDFLMLDMEHGAFTFHDLSNMCGAAQATGFTLLVRVPELTRGNVSRALDCGASGVMVPMLETVEQARQLVQWAKFAPLGARGLATVGAHTGFARQPDAAEFMRRANDESLTIAQIETVKAVEAIDAIAALPGLDALLVGPNDLSVSCGKPGQLDCIEVQSGIERVARAARSQRKIFGLHAGIPMIEKWRAHGLTLAMNSLDIDLLGQGFENIARALPANTKP